MYPFWLQAHVGGFVHRQCRSCHSPYQPGVQQMANLSHHYNSGQHFLPNLEHLFSGKKDEKNPISTFVEKFAAAAANFSAKHLFKEETFLFLKGQLDI